jgi:hypothetical protein
MRLPGSKPKPREPEPWEASPRYYNLSKIQFDSLALYNVERSRGIVHTDEWTELMAKYQKIYNNWIDREYAAYRDGLDKPK